jgi:hypothetical protein
MADESSEGDEIPEGDGINKRKEEEMAKRLAKEEQIIAIGWLRRCSKLKLPLPGGPFDQNADRSSAIIETACLDEE